MSTITNTETSIDDSTILPPADVQVPIPADPVEPIPTMDTGNGEPPPDQA